MDNIFTEGLYRLVKHEPVHINDYRTVRETKEGISRYPGFYNQERDHHFA